jgi:hypothetical protein
MAWFGEDVANPFTFVMMIVSARSRRVAYPGADEPIRCGIVTERPPEDLMLRRTQRPCALVAMALRERRPSGRGSVTAALEVNRRRPATRLPTRCPDAAMGSWPGRRVHAVDRQTGRAR